MKGDKAGLEREIRFYTTRDEVHIAHATAAAEPCLPLRTRSSTVTYST